MKKLIFLMLVSLFANAKPHWDQSLVPTDSSYSFTTPSSVDLKFNFSKKTSEGKPSLRIMVAWDANTETYAVANKVLEYSGTESLYLRAKTESKFGSFKGQINTGSEIYFDSIGTGQAYRKLARVITFRFPLPKNNSVFEMKAENPVTGEMEKVLTEEIKISDLTENAADLKDLEVRFLKTASKSPALKIAIYADGFALANKNHFFASAVRVVDTFKNQNIPSFEAMEFTAVFASSNTALGEPKNLGMPVKTRDSALGLYYPYWYNFGRWYDVVYPTNEEKFRSALAVVPYDYNIVLMDSSKYFGVGNFRSHTAIPTKGNHFVFLLVHEFGHYMGLNEEYDGGGKTELEFAPQIKEAWSQNMTFLPSMQLQSLKWIDSITDFSTPIPTPVGFWTKGKFGAYRGGYADSQNTFSESYKPGLGCVMDHGPNFCDVCLKGISEVIDHDLGKKNFLEL